MKMVIEQEKQELSQDPETAELMLDTVAKNTLEGKSRRRMPARHALAIWRIRRAENMLRERMAQLDVDFDDDMSRGNLEYRIKPDFRPEIAEVAQIRRMAKAPTPEQLASMGEEVQIALQMQRMVDVMEAMAIRKPEEEEGTVAKYGGAFLVAIAAGIALIFWEAVA